MTINFSDENEIFTPLAKFLEAEQNESTFKQVAIHQHHKSGAITAKTIKLPNCVFNLKNALAEIKLSDIQEVRHYLKIDWVTILETILASSFPKVYLVIWFLKKVIHSITVEVTETDALVLYTLWYVANSGLPGREIWLPNFHKSALIADVEADTLQQSLENLEALKCIQVESDKIILMEQIRFEKIYED